MVKLRIETAHLTPQLREQSGGIPMAAHTLNAGLEIHIEKTDASKPGSASFGLGSMEGSAWWSWSPLLPSQWYAGMYCMYSKETMLP